MGKVFSKSCCQGEEETIIDNPFTTRENMATWYRVNIAVTDVYEVIKTLGEGRMGEVLHVRRKDGGRTHTETTKQKEDELGNSMRGGSGSSRMRSNSNRSERSYSERSERSSSSNHSSFRWRVATKKNGASMAGQGYKDSMGSFPDGDGVQCARKEPPDLTKTAKPSSILKSPTHGSPTKNGEQSIHSMATSTGMSTLAIGKDIFNDDDDSDEEVPLNINAIRPPKDSSTSVENVKDTMDLHPKFAEPDDENSLISDVSLIDDQVADDIVIDDDIREEKKPDSKKWVPRRRVFFRRHYACKTIKTENIKRDQMTELLNEIYMMRKLDHPYIIRLYEVYQVDRKIWLVMDLCTGSDLASKKNELNERQVAIVAEQVLRGVAYLHRRNICHRDLKMENIMFETHKPNSSIRLIDFGLSQTYDQIGSKKKKNVGNTTVYTMSPEVLANAPYTEKSDVWSIGVIIWILLSGDYPFLRQESDLKNESKRDKLLKGEYHFGITWSGRGITKEAKTFVKGCLKREPSNRWTALEALEYLQDTWIPLLEEKYKDIVEEIPRKNARKRQDSMKLYTKKFLPPPSTISERYKKKGGNIFDKGNLIDIKRFAQYSLLKKTILVLMANTMDSQDVGEVRELFLLIDTNQSGTITLPELKDVIDKVESSEMNEKDVEEIFKAIDYDHSGEIHYAEFLAALSGSQGLITIDRLEDCFDRIDRFGNGFVSPDDLQHILGGNFSKDEIASMIEEGDFKNNGQIDFDEFLQLMMGDAEEEAVTVIENNPAVFFSGQ